MRRLCVHVILHADARAGEVRVAHVTFAVGEAFGVCSIQTARPRYAVVPDLHRQRMPSSAIYLESSVSECVRLCDAHMAYTYAYGM